MSPILRIATALVLAGAAASCRAPSARFQPAEPNLTNTADRVPGALYELKDKDGTRHGELRVWCLGAEQEGTDEDGRRLTYIDIGVEIENSSKSELRFERQDARLRAVQADGELIDSVAPFEPDPTQRIAPDSVAKTYLSFELPPGIAPRDVRGFRFRWEVRDDKEGSFSDFTSFIRWQRPRRSYSGPFWPFWGFGFGYALGRRRW